MSLIGCCEIDKHSSGFLRSRKAVLDILCQQGDLVYGRPHVSKARLLLREQWVDDWFDCLRDRNYYWSSPCLWNFDLAHAGSEEIAKPRFESRPGVEYKLREDRIHTRRLSGLQAPEGGSRILWREGARYAVSLSCWDLP